MATAERSRVIRPSSRRPDSSYKVDIDNKVADDDLCVTVTHESDASFMKKYYFKAGQLHGKKSIHFDWSGGDVVWKGGIIPYKVE